MCYRVVYAAVRYYLCCCRCRYRCRFMCVAGEARLMENADYRLVVCSIQNDSFKNFLPPCC